MAELRFRVMWKCPDCGRNHTDPAVPLADALAAVELMLATEVLIVSIINEAYAMENDAQRLEAQEAQQNMFAAFFRRHGV